MKLDEFGRRLLGLVDDELFVRGDSGRRVPQGFGVFDGEARDIAFLDAAWPVAPPLRNKEAAP